MSAFTCKQNQNYMELRPDLQWGKGMADMSLRLKLVLKHLNFKL